MHQSCEYFEYFVSKYIQNNNDKTNNRKAKITQKVSIKPTENLVPQEVSWGLNVYRVSGDSNQESKSKNIFQRPVEWAYLDRPFYKGGW